MSGPAPRTRPVTGGVTAAWHHDRVRPRPHGGVPSRWRAVHRLSTRPRVSSNPFRPFPSTRPFSQGRGSHGSGLRRPRPLPLRPAARAAGAVPPAHLEAEESLLGAMLLSTDAASAAMEICSAADFYKPAHGHIFGAIRALCERGEPVDAVTVTDELRRSGLLEAGRRPADLVSLQANTPSIANAAHYAAIVEEHALLRRLIGVAGEIAEIGYSVPEDVKAAVDEAEQHGLRRGRAAHHRHDARRCTICSGRAWTGSRSSASAGTPHRAWPPGTSTSTRSCRTPALLADHRRRPPGHGQDQLRPRHAGPRGHRAPAAGAPVLPRDGPPGADPAPLGLRGRGRRPEPADGPDPHAGLGQDRRWRSPGCRARRSSSTTTRTSR